MLDHNFDLRAHLNCEAIRVAFDELQEFKVA